MIRETVCGCHVPPQAVGTPRSVSSAAICRADMPALVSSVRTGFNWAGPIHCRCPIGRGQDISAVTTEANAASLRGLKRCFGPRPDHFALVLGDGGENVKGQPGGMRIVDGHKFDVAVHQGRQ